MTNKTCQNSTYTSVCLIQAQPICICQGNLLSLCGHSDCLVVPFANGMHINKFPQFFSYIYGEISDPYNNVLQNETFIEKLDTTTICKMKIDNVVKDVI